MSDQAHDLRRLVLETKVVSRTVPRRARLVAVAAGRKGAGATTVAVNLAAALAQRSLGAAVIETAGSDAGVGSLCGLPDGPSLGDVLSGRSTLQESLQAGSGGLLALPALKDDGSLADAAPAAWDLLIEQCRRVGPPGTTVVADVGDGGAAAARRFWQAADVVILVAGPELSAVADAYAAIKGLGPGRDVPLRLVVNFATHREAAEIHGRLAWTCLRFLGRSLQSAAHVPSDAAVALAAQSGRPLVLGSPRSGAARQIAALAEALQPTGDAADPGQPCDPLADKKTRVTEARTAQEWPAWGR